MMYPSNFRNYLTFSMLSNQSTNRMAANNGVGLNPEPSNKSRTATNRTPNLPLCC